MTTLFIDIETIATTRPDYRDRVGANIKPPGPMKKAETIAEWENTQKATAIDDKVAQSVFDGGLCHVVQIQYAIGDDNTNVVMATKPSDEASIIQSLFDNTRNKNILNVCGHDVHRFDITILRKRAIVLGLDMPPWLRLAYRAKPWDAIIFDTMIEWCGLKDTVSMDNLCYYLGVETPKQEVCGANFGEFYARGDFEALSKYGHDEIKALREVYKKLKV